MSKYSDNATWLAFQLRDDLNKNLGFESRGVKFANFQVLRETVEYCASILLELGFMSNEDEARHLKVDDNVFAIGLSILGRLQIKE